MKKNILSNQRDISSNSEMHSRLRNGFHHDSPILPQSYKPEFSFIKLLYRFKPTTCIFIAICFLIVCRGFFLSKPHQVVEIKASTLIDEKTPVTTKSVELHSFTGILLHFKRRNGVKKVLEIMLDYPFISNVIIWNNNIEVVLNHSMLVDTRSDSTKQHEQLALYKKKVFIYNSKENLKDKAKYLACSLATTTACFYSDDDWDISRYTNTLLADFYNEPKVIHSVTEPYTYYTNLIWSFYDKSIDLHTNFAWIGCGAMFLKEVAIDHLEKIEKLLESRPDLKKLVPLSDVFFSIWQNTPPSQIVANIVELRVEKENHGFSSQAGFGELQHMSSVMAIKILHDELRNYPRSTIFNKKEVENPFPLYLKAPSHTDAYMVYSDLYPFLIKDVPFNITKPLDAIRSTRQNLPSGPVVDFFFGNSMTMAADNNPSTCWRANRATETNSFFGIDLHSVRNNVTVKIYFGHCQEFQFSLKIKYSTNRLTWTEFTGEVVHDSISTATYRFDGHFRYVEFVSPTATHTRFVVCEVIVFQNGTRI